MQVFTAPEHCHDIETKKRSLFLGGGISNCGDWQQEIIRKLSQLDITIINPRRPGVLDRKDKIVSNEQIIWEHFYLRECSEVLFWFPPSSVCPITLFELGSALERWSLNLPENKQTIYIGCDAKYERILDVEIQSSLIFKNLKIVYSLNDLVKQIVRKNSLTENQIYSKI